MAAFFLTRRASIDLLEIEARSLEKWSLEQTEEYMDELYVSFNKIAINPDMGRLRQERSFPFYMAPVQQHLAIYKPTDNGIIIATVLHKRRNIEAIVKRMAHTLADEIEAMQRGN